MIVQKNLIFLISQPRSGSSLLQQLLINTGQIKSVPEPWFMLSLVETYRKTQNQSGYNPYYAHVNFMEYLERYKESKVEFINEIKRLAIKLYNLNTLKGDENYFLDKTPRYYHILEELKELFPLAKFIFLIRNPIAVFSSILDYNFGGDVNKVFKEDRYHDLFTAPKNIVSVIKNWEKDDYTLLHYEDLVNNPENTLGELNAYLQISATKTELSYEVDEVFLKSRGIDKKGVPSNNTVNNKFLDSWKKSIDNLQKKKLLTDYIEKLGPEIIKVLGYNYKDLVYQISHHRVKRKLPVKYDYLIHQGQEIGLKDFIKSRLNEKLNKLFKL